MRFAALVLTLALSTPAFADSPQAQLDSARAAFAERADLAQANLAAQILRGLDAAAGIDEETQYTARVLLSRTYYYLGTNLAENDKEGRLRTFEDGYLAAQRASALIPDYADAYYSYAINLSKWGLAKGKMNALNRLPELKKALNDTIARSAQDGTQGKELDGHGADRVYGAIYWELPSLAGGDNRKSLQHLETAARQAPTYALNVAYLARTLNEFGAAEKARARKLLADLMATAPETLNPDRVPETRLELVEIRRDILPRVR